MTDRPVKFFVGEMIREKIFSMYEDEIPYHTAVLVQEFKEKWAKEPVSISPIDGEGLKALIKNGSDKLRLLHIYTV